MGKCYPNPIIDQINSLLAQHYGFTHEELDRGEKGELLSEATIRQYRIVQTEGDRQVGRLVEYYNLGMILAIGYRVRSPRGESDSEMGYRVQSVRKWLEGFYL